jgi:drug/metabolite transporter (DMT)-like permease
MSLLAIPAVLLAAFTFAVAIPLEHRAAVRTPQMEGFAPRQIGAFVRATVQNKWWLIGMGLNTLGFGLHAVALNLGPLAVVQPLLVTNMLFALPVNHWFRREAIRKQELAWAGVLLVGLSGFLLIGTTGVEHTRQPADLGPAIAAGVLIVLTAGGLAVAARRSGRNVAPVLLGVATGVLFAVTASLVKEVGRIVTQHPVALLTSWQLYALLVAGSVALVFNQLAYQAGPLSSSLPAIAVVDPLVSVLIGVIVFDEHLRHTPAAIVGEVVCLGLLALSGINLSRLEQVAEKEEPAAG